MKPADRKRNESLHCVVSKNDRGELIGYVDRDENDRISEYRGYSPEEWIVNRLPMDGGVANICRNAICKLLTVSIPEHGERIAADSNGNRKGERS